MQTSHLEIAKTALNHWKKDPSMAPQVEGVFECHIFCEPLNPSAEEIERFVAACKNAGLRPLCLALNFEQLGMVSVLQTTKYYETTADDALAMMISDAEKIQEHFPLLRLKLESLASNAGVPKNNDEAARFPGDSYFEYHIKLNREHATPEHDEELKDLAAQLTADLKIKTPFSCNNLGNSTQRFLNARTYALGSQQSADLIASLVAKIEERDFEVDKVISEFIVYDTNKALDRGWLEFDR